MRLFKSPKSQLLETYKCYKKLAVTFFSSSFTLFFQLSPIYWIFDTPKWGERYFLQSFLGTLTKFWLGISDINTPPSLLTDRPHKVNRRQILVIFSQFSTTLFIFFVKITNIMHQAMCLGMKFYDKLIIIFCKTEFKIRFHTILFLDVANIFQISKG